MPSISIFMNEMHYQVGDQIFFNKFQAANYAYKIDQKIKFNLFESAFDAANWAVEPGQSWNSLLDIRAHQVAEKAKAQDKPIVLHFSGGTDAYTIYKVFERNNIHIDMLYTRVRKGERYQSQYRQVYEFFDKGLYDPHCQIVVDDEELGFLEKKYHSEDWIWDTAERYTFNLHGGMKVEHDKICTMLGRDVMSIIGYEKPRLHFDENGRVYSFQDDINYVRPMNCLSMECFFLTPDLPELHVKQSYMLLNYIKSKNPNARDAKDLLDYNDLHSPIKFDWLEYSLASGRYGDLANSRNPHIANWGCQLIVDNPADYTTARLIGQSKEVFDSARDTKWFKDYVKSMLNVCNDSAGKYLGMSTNNLFAIPMIRSKYYPLTF